MKNLTDNEMKSDLLEQILQNMQDAVFSLDEKGNVLTTNGPAREILGRFLESPLENRLGMSVLWFEDDGSTLLDAKNLPTNRCLNGESVKKTTICLSYDDGRPVKWLSISGSPIVLENGKKGCVIVARDISEIVNQEFKMRIQLEQNKQLLQSLEQSNNELYVADVKRKNLLNILAHDLRNPLSSMNLAIEDFAMEEDVDKDYVLAIFKGVNKNIKSLLKLTEDILQESLNEKCTSEDWPRFEKVLEHATSNISQQARNKGIKLTENVEDGTPPIRVNATLFVLAIENLLSNSIKFSRPGDTISVLAKGNGNQLEIKIRDTGVGIPEELLPQLFSGSRDVQREGTNNEASTGFGLSFVNEVVSEAGGKISVESEENEFTEFTISLPIAA